MMKQSENNRECRNESISWAVKAGILDAGDPHAFVTREEATEMIRRALDYFFHQIILVLQEKNLDL